MALQFTTSCLEDSLSLFRQYRKLAEAAMAQVSDDDFFRVTGAEDNSIAVIVKHVAGNLRSRWTDFLTSDGEKPWRDRDAEFELAGGDSRPALMAAWEAGWSALLGALEALPEDAISRTVTIRGEAHSVMQAIHRALAHCAYHTGQIVFLAKHRSAGEWRTLTVPRGQSKEFNRRVQAGEASQR